MIINSLAEPRELPKEETSSERASEQASELASAVLKLPPSIFFACHDQTIKNQHLREWKFNFAHCTFRFAIDLSLSYYNN